MAVELPRGVRGLLESDLYGVVLSTPTFMVWRSPGGVMVEFHLIAMPDGDEVLTCAVTSDSAGNIAHTESPTAEWFDEVLP
jgi:hypothetical protein